MSLFLILCIALVVSFFFAELVVGIVAKSLALLADAFHMLSDAISLVIGLSALLLSKRRGNEKFTYGFERAETLGGLINSVFLLSAVLFITMEAIERFSEPSFISDPWLVFGVGTGGMLINLLGMIMFCGGGHGHSHGGHGHSHGGGHGHSHGGNENSESEHNETESQNNNKKTKKKTKKTKSHNMMGVFLHVFGDFLGSIAVIVASILNLIFVDPNDPNKNVWVKYIDPSLSVIMAFLILITSVPLVIGTSKILLQSVPDAVNVKKLKSGLIQINGVSDVHELHVWSVAHGKKLIGSVHLSLDDSFDMHNWDTLAHSAKDIFHIFGIHSTTIQPEITPKFLKRQDVKVIGHLCTQLCSSLDCSEDRCCPPAKIKISQELQNHLDERERNIRIRRNVSPTNDLNHDSPNEHSHHHTHESSHSHPHRHSHRNFNSQNEDKESNIPETNLIQEDPIQQVDPIQILSTNVDDHLNESQV